MNTQEFSQSELVAFQRAVSKFGARQMEEFVDWAKTNWEENPPAVLSINPPNHVYDVEDGTQDLTVGTESVMCKLAHHRELATGVFRYDLVKTGTFQEVSVHVVECLQGDEQLEAVMAFYVRFAERSYLCNCPEWRDLARSFGPLPEGTDNPFYSGVSKLLLEKLGEVVRD